MWSHVECHQIKNIIFFDRYLKMSRLMVMFTPMKWNQQMLKLNFKKKLFHNRIIWYFLWNLRSMRIYWLITIEFESIEFSGLWDNLAVKEIGEVLLEQNETYFWRHHTSYHVSAIQTEVTEMLSVIFWCFQIKINAIIMFLELNNHE